MIKPIPDMQIDFWSRVLRVDSGCWEWQGMVRSQPGFPYGKVKHRGSTYSAHRLAWRLVFGEIPVGKWILHRCDNPRCVSIFHIYCGTPKDNAQDRVTRHRVKKARGPNKAVGGEKNINAKLTWSNVDEARRLHAENGIPTPELAKRYGVSRQAMWRALRGIGWIWR